MEVRRTTRAWRRGGGTPAALRTLALAAVIGAAWGCSGPQGEGWFADRRGRTQLISEAEEKAPPPLPGPHRAEVRVFPLLYRERHPLRAVNEVLWPLFESGRSSESSYLRLCPFFQRTSFRDRTGLVVFPFYWRLREERETGPRSVDHLWPLYGLHRRLIDLAPTATHHVLYPVFSLALAENRWKARVFPVVSLSRGFLDRGWWFFPVVKTGVGKGGWKGGHRFLYILDPLLAVERFSIAGGRRPETPLDTRTEVNLLGGLLGWERSAEGLRLRFFWIRF